MKSKLFTAFGKKFISFFCLLLLLAGLLGGTVSAQGKVNTAGELETFIDGITAWKMAQTSAGSVQELIDKGLAPDAGTSPTDWFLIALRQYKTGLNLSAYTAALNRYVAGMVSQNAASRQRIALTYTAGGSNASFIQTTLDTSIGKLGVMSDIYGLLLLDSGGYVSTVTDRNAVILSLLSLEQSDGGWALSGSVSDTDVTAMAIQALAPYTSFSDVKTAVGKALALLSKRQLETGDCVSWGTRNAESTAQVIAALSALGLNCQIDSRFIKNGHTLLDGLLLYRRADGSFSHTPGGGSNYTSSVQSLDALVAAWRQAKGLGTLYKFADKTVARRVTASSGQTTTAKAGAPSASSSSAPSGQTDRATAAGSTTAPAGPAQTIAASPTAIGSVSQTTAGAANGAGSITPSYGYKPWACGVIALLGLLALGWLYLRKKLHLKNILPVCAITAGLLLATLFTNIQTVDQYYSTHPEAIPSGSPTVTISIRCDTAVGKTKTVSLPSDGCILAPTRYALHGGDTVFDILQRAVRSQKLPMEYKNEAGTTYIRGIDYLYEFDCGDTSGWMYRVNGKFQSTGCSSYSLSDGDVIEWVYTCDLGKDVGGSAGGASQ